VCWSSIKGFRVYVRPEVSLVVRQRKAIKAAFKRDNKSFHSSWTPICTVVKLCLPMRSTDYACASDIQKEMNITVFVSLPVRQECAVNIIRPCHLFFHTVPWTIVLVCGGKGGQVFYFLVSLLILHLVCSRISGLPASQ